MRLLLILLCIPLLMVVPLRWINPPLTSFMAIRQVAAWTGHQRGFRLHYQWQDYQHISSQLLMAVIASEDQKFPDHHGIDFHSVRMAINRWHSTGHLRGASTITQQVSKNLFLWGGRSLFRKALEAYFSIWLELILSKKRILELYVNIAEFGNGIYGAEAASRHFFGKPASRLGRRQAAIMAAVLPNPKIYHINRPSLKVLRKSRWIQKQISQLGGTRYLLRLSRLRPTGPQPG